MMVRSIGFETKKVERKPKLNTPQPNYSTVTDCVSKWVFRYPNSLLCFDIDLSSHNLQIPNYSQYQHFLYETIIELRNKEMNDVQIANWLNENGHLTPRENTFRNNSRIKKKISKRIV